MEQDQHTSLFSLNLDAQNSYTLRSAATWAKVLGIVGMIMGILFIIIGIMVQQTVNRYSSYGYRNSGISTSAIGNIGMAVYLIMGLIMILSSVFALNMGNRISQALRANDQAALNAGFGAARNYFAIWAIVIIIMLFLVLISVLSTMG